MPLKFNKLESNIVFYFNPTVDPIEIGIRLMGTVTLRVIVVGDRIGLIIGGPKWALLVVSVRDISIGARPMYQKLYMVFAPVRLCRPVQDSMWGPPHNESESTIQTFLLYVTDLKGFASI
eukprot:TRINITY_DN9368_c0_g1_i1.p1 TRINITY_DN9368_c0_g1~~TRINITY_DN9368_c0_g1_i1.p1  ORF type:complete len:120 (+),score=3.72 TRINITY_DN9368_c0_g1_i1:152-511(+)